MELVESSVVEYETQFPVSRELSLRAKRIFPNGVTHDGRHLDPFPVSISRAEGSKKYAVDGQEIIDYWMGHGSLLLGHSHPAVVHAVQKQVALGTHFGACHELEVRWGELVRQLVPSADSVRFVNSGTEATLMALRISRIVTGRRKVLKFAGHFHGWHDLLIPGAEAPHETGHYEMPGIPAGVMDDLVIVPPNDVAALEQALIEHQPACVILEPTGGHWGQVPIRGEFLHRLRELTTTHGSLLIFDEVITGFRVSPGGAQLHYNVTPDLTTMAKILAGGLPGGALAGRSDLMEALQFENRYNRKMKHPGTYNGNPLSAAAGIAALEIVAEGEACHWSNELGQRLRAGLNTLFQTKSVNWVAYGEFSMVTVLPDYDGPRPTDDSFIPCNNELTKLDRKISPKLSHAFRRGLLLSGVDFFGWRAMLSAAHLEEDIDHTVAAMSDCIDRLRGDGILP